MAEGTPPLVVVSIDGMPFAVPIQNVLEITRISGDDRRRRVVVESGFGPETLVVDDVPEIAA